MSNLTREQETAEQLQALITVLEAENVLPKDWADSIRNASDHASGQEIARAARDNGAAPEMRDNQFQE